ncbi:hypothetical protein J8273_0812 [Carpediemonas membranifera]|uniref:Uncharacterized protein n=1 Tax=Carpediemonas membranifera TaxID=201153 RepID=A0A8J6BD28_9EUKA|nr:hypothetical protein J8273_0812 [Carpediemonas membranifera]|eukprot:KAG9397682.1 hypothetical protein J8273_0812 [Carpediemonas membranifera]
MSSSNAVYLDTSGDQNEKTSLLNFENTDMMEKTIMELDGKRHLQVLSTTTWSTHNQFRRSSAKINVMSVGMDQSQELDKISLLGNSEQVDPNSMQLFCLWRHTDGTYRMRKINDQYRMSRTTFEPQSREELERLAESAHKSLRERTKKIDEKIKDENKDRKIAEWLEKETKNEGNEFDEQDGHATDDDDDAAVEKDLDQVSRQFFDNVLYVEAPEDEEEADESMSEDDGQEMDVDGEMRAQTGKRKQPAQEFDRNDKAYANTVRLALEDYVGLEKGGTNENTLHNFLMTQFSEIRTDKKKLSIVKQVLKMCLDRRDGMVFLKAK